MLIIHSQGLLDANAQVPTVRALAARKMNAILKLQHATKSSPEIEVLQRQLCPAAKDLSLGLEINSDSTSKQKVSRYLPTHDPPRTKLPHLLSHVLSHVPIQNPWAPTSNVNGAPATLPLRSSPGCSPDKLPHRSPAAYVLGEAYFLEQSSPFPIS